MPLIKYKPLYTLKKVLLKCLNVFVLFFLVSFFVSSFKISFATPPNSPNPDFWVPDNSSVTTMAEGDDGTIYIGGSFHNIGPATGPGVVMNNTTAVLGTYPFVRGGPPSSDNVRHVISDGSGGWFIGGRFTSIGDESIANIAHIESDGSVDPTIDLTFSADPNIDAMAFGGSTLYIGGQFTTVDGQSRNGLVAIDTTTGDVTSWDAGAVGFTDVKAIKIDGSTIYVGGLFDNIGGQTRYGLAALDSTTGLATSWDPSNVLTIIVSIDQDASNIYVAGEFATMGGSSRNNIAAVSKATGLATAWDPNADQFTTYVYVAGSDVYVDGAFATIGGATRDGFAELSITTGLATSWDPGTITGSTQGKLEANGADVFITGFFTDINGSARTGIAALDRSTAAVTSWNANITGTIASFALSGGDIYIGGRFTTAGSEVVERNSVAAIDPTTGEPTSWNPDADGSVTTLLATGSTVYVGGFFDNIGGAAHSKLAALSATTGLATAFDAGTLDNAPWKLVIVDDTLYVGGFFTTIGGGSRNYLAALDATTGALDAWDPNPSDFVTALELGQGDEPTMYIGGFFTSVDGTTRNHAAEVELSTGDLTTWNPDVNGGDVYAIKLGEGVVYLGGYFTSVGGQTRNRIASVATTSGDVETWDPNAEDGVLSIKLLGPLIYVSGDFISIGGQSRNYAATLSPETGLAGDWNPNLSSFSIYNVLIHQNGGSTDDFELYLGGDYNFANNEPNAFFSAYSFPDDYAPILVEVEPVEDPTSDASPSYTFNSTEDGTASYGGSCSSSTTAITAGDNTITFNSLPDGTYTDCTIIVTDSDDNVSETLDVSDFTISGGGFGVDTEAPTTPGKPTTSTPTDDKTPRFTWGESSDNVAIDHYEIQWCKDEDFDDCGDNTATKDNNAYTFEDDLSNGTWFIRVRAIDTSDNESEWSTIKEFVIDTEDPDISDFDTNTDTNSIEVTFGTDEDTTALLEWGTSTDYGRETDTSDLDDSYSFEITDLQPGTTYYIRVTVTDEAGNVTEKETTAKTNSLSTPPPASGSTEPPPGEAPPPVSGETPVSGAPTTPTSGGEAPVGSETESGGTTVTLETSEETKSVIETVQEGLSSVISRIGNLSQNILNNEQVIETVENFKEISETPTSQSASVVTVLAPSIVAVAATTPSLFAVLPFVSLSQLPGLIAGLVRKKRHPWGVVFDSFTKQPLDPVVFTLNDEAGKEVAQTISDLYGRYEFLVPAGTYFLKVAKTGYQFPSQKYSGIKSDEVYEDIYLGEKVAISEGGKIAFNIPMDPINVDFNEAAKAAKYNVRGVSKSTQLLIKASGILFKIGFIYSAIVAAFSLSTLNIVNLVIFGLYSIVAALRFYRAKARSWGTIFDKFGAPVSNAVVKLVNIKIPQFKISPVVTDASGRYIYLMDKGTYQVQVQLKDPIQNIYVPRYTSQPIQIEKEYGSIAEDVKLL